MKLEVGKTYRLNNGDIHSCEGMRGNDPHLVDSNGYGPFVVDGCWYHQDGKFGDGNTYELDVAAEFTGINGTHDLADRREDAPSTPAKPDTPKTWGEMTDAEKGALLLAHHEGKAIESKFPKAADWLPAGTPAWVKGGCYRIKPESVVGEEKLHGLQVPKGEYIFISESRSEDTHTLTLPTLDGQLVTGEFVDEGGMKVVIEEKK